MAGSRAAWRKRVTTREPGAKVVFTCGFTDSPFSIAFFARSPAAIITDGFDVFVQLVIAAMTTDPSVTCSVRGLYAAATVAGGALASLRRAGAFAGFGHPVCPGGVTPLVRFGS